MASGFPQFDVEQLKKKDDAQYWDADRLRVAVNDLMKEAIYVVDAASEDYVAGVQQKIDNSTGLHDHGFTQRYHQTGRLVHIVALSYKYCRQGVLYDCSTPTLLKDVLQLGADPDAFDSMYQTVSHLCTSHGLVACVEVISKCRPDLGLVLPSVGVLGNQLLAYAMSHPAGLASPPNARMEVAEIWRKVGQHGFPSLAQLAHDQEWYAVHNLCRRRVISEEEKRKRYEGQTAVEWARFHGQEKVVEEMLYLLEIDESEEILQVGHVASDESPETSRQSAAAANPMMEEDTSKLETKVASLEADKAVLTEEVGRLGEALEEQGSQLAFVTEELKRLKADREAEMEKLQAGLNALPSQISSMLPSLIESTVAAAFGAANNNTTRDQHD